MTSNQINRALIIAIKDPVLIGVSLVFAGLLYVANQQANIYDISNHGWVITMAVLILASPLAHSLFLTRMRADLEQRPASAAAGLAAGGALYTRLVGGEIAVSLIAAVGMLLILPGIYIGLRLSLYKQAILFNGKTVSGALRESMARTRHPRQWGTIFLIYTLIYGGELLIMYGVGVALIGVVADILAVAASALGFAWLNALLTVIYIQPGV